jgi:hypothetical protein
MFIPENDLQRTDVKVWLVIVDLCNSNEEALKVANLIS